MADRMTGTVMAVLKVCLSDAGFVVEELADSLLSVENGMGGIAQIQVQRISTELAHGGINTPAVDTSSLATISDSISAATENVAGNGPSDSEHWFGSWREDDAQGKG